MEIRLILPSRQLLRMDFEKMVQVTGLQEWAADFYRAAQRL